MAKYDYTITLASKRFFELQRLGLDETADILYKCKITKTERTGTMHIKYEKR